MRTISLLMFLAIMLTACQSDPIVVTESVKNNQISTTQTLAPTATSTLTATALPASTLTSQPTNTPTPTITNTPTITPTPITAFSSLWVNENPQTRSIPQVHIFVDGSKLYAHVWGSCTPVWCDWGIEQGSVNEGIAEIFWDAGFVEERLFIELLDADRLQVTTYSHFTDNSGRADRETIDIFQRSNKSTVTPPP
jgi:hypothetical protein